MKKSLTLALAVMMALSASAAKKKTSAKDANKPVFTTIKENPITTIKDQNRSGTCWDYSTLSFFEAEILKATGKKYTLCEAFVANKTYMERAIQVVRYHGDCQFAQGGSSEDVLHTLKTHGICPIDAMPFPGSLYGDSLNNFNEFFGVLEPYVAAVAKSDAKKISNAWKTGMQGILDAYLGKCPEKFTYEGKEYTPKSFMGSLGINLDDYVSITSYTHHPFYTAFAVEVQDNWRFPLSYNVPMDEMMQIIDNAINNGYTVAWGGDVSEPGFTRNGLAILVDTEAKATSGSDQERWVGKAEDKPAEKAAVKEIEVTQENRQLWFDEKTSTDDHGMHLYGIAKDQNGNKFYLIKNSWGESGEYKGIWYMSEQFCKGKALNILVNKKAVPKEILKKLGLK